MTYGNERKTAKKMKKSWFKIAVCMIMLAASVFTATYAAFASYDITILLNGEKIKTEEAPFIENGSVLIPFRDVFEALDATVSWDGERRAAQAEYEGVTVKIYPDEGVFEKNGEVLLLPAVPKIVNDKIMVPLRAASESFGYNVLWNGDTYTVSISDTSLMRVYFLDCGQADCIFAELPDGKCMLIDAAESSFGKSLETFIKEKGYSNIDYVVATHPHADHIGAMAHILENFTVGTFYMPEKSHTTKTFEKMLNALEKNGCECIYVSGGKSLFRGEYEANVLSPLKSDYVRMNDFSAVIKLLYKNISFLFSADAEANAENDMINAGFELKTDILKVGHHASPTSSTASYLEAVKPKEAVISVGKDNKYGFPSPLVLSQLEKAGARIYRTDIHSTVTAVTDGYIYVMDCANN